MGKQASERVDEKAWLMARKIIELETIERFRGGLLGLACGDAVGTTVEFMQRGSFPHVTDMLGGGPFKLNPGEWTDDTSMALCLAESLVECNGFDATDQMQRYIKWLDEGYWSSNGHCFDIGGTTHAALKNFKRTSNPFSGSIHAQSAGNGCIMRLAPVPMFFYPDRDAAIEMSGKSSRTTHGAAECIEASRLFGAILFNALGGADKEEILLGHGLGGFESGGIQAIAQGGYRDKSKDEISGIGYVVSSLEAALWCFYRTDNFKEAILHAANLGDDSDRNEAKLTQFALSVRFAASLVNLHESDLKLLVLDDLLVSLDMSNRMKVVEILLSETFANYQKIILTHELGFFREFGRKLGAGHPEWCFLRLEGNAATKIEAKREKTDIQKAEDYLHGHNLDEAALSLRKACEDTAQRYLNRDNAVDPTKEFTGLRENLRAARNRALRELPAGLYEKVLRDTPEVHRDLLVSITDDDIDGNGTLDAATKGILKTQRKRLRQLLKAEHVERLRQIKLIDDILACTERVLNPAAHFGTSPLYKEEVQSALVLIKQLEAIV